MLRASVTVSLRCSLCFAEFLFFFFGFKVDFWLQGRILRCLSAVANLLFLYWPSQSWFCLILTFYEATSRDALNKRSFKGQTVFLHWDPISTECSVRSGASETQINATVKLRPLLSFHNASLSQERPLPNWDGSTLLDELQTSRKVKHFLSLQRWKTVSGHNAFVMLRLSFKTPGKVSENVFYPTTANCDS